jgi:Domain of unknown function (DUF222)
MTAAVLAFDPGTVPPVDGDDALTAELADMLVRLGDVAQGCVVQGGEASDAARIDRIAVLERLKAAAGAAQAAEMVQFGVSQVAAQRAADVHPRTLGRGIGEQIALACKTSPSEGSRRLGVARALWFDLPETYGLFTRGEISEYVAQLIVTETRHLDAPTRRQVDSRIVAAGVAGMSPRSAAGSARRLAYEADPEAAVTRGRKERKHRRVTLRPAPDTMSLLNAYLPVEQGVACFASLKKHTDSLVADGDERARDQIMADTLVERLTGQARAEDVNAEVQVLLPVDALLDPNTAKTAEISTFGPLPARLARDILANSQGLRWWRRLFTAPNTGGSGSGPIIGGDPFRRRFDGWLAKLISLRDQHCRDPFCDAQIRHLDHIIRHADGGQTTFSNGRGVCARGNYVREMPGWQIKVIIEGLHGQPHTTRTTTPTGHVYFSQAPQPP